MPECKILRARGENVGKTKFTPISPPRGVLTDLLDEALIILKLEI